MNIEPPPRPSNKYGAIRQACNHGHEHASRKEARRCNALHRAQKAGRIAGLVSQPQYWFTINGAPVLHESGRRVGFKPDFAYMEAGRQIAEDSKGVRTKDYILRVAFFRHLYPEIEFRET